MNQVVTKTTREAEIVSLDDLYREAERLDVTPGWVSRDRPIFWKDELLRDRRPRDPHRPAALVRASNQVPTAAASTLAPLSLW